MNFLSVSEIAKLWNLSERSVRNYCAEGRISGAMLVGKTWMIPGDALKPNRKERVSDRKKTLLDILLGFNASPGIIQVLPTSIAPEILPSAQ